MKTEMCLYSAPNNSSHCFEVISIHINKTGNILTWHETNKKKIEKMKQIFVLYHQQKRKRRKDKTDQTPLIYKN